MQKTIDLENTYFLFEDIYHFYPKSSVPEIQQQKEQVITLIKNKYSNELADVLINDPVKQLLDRIVNSSGKSYSEAILVLLATYRYLQPETENQLAIGTAEDFKIESKKKVEHFINFINKRYKDVLKCCITHRVQGSTFTRGYPVAEVLGSYFPQKKLAVIELGAASGLIGSFLLNARAITEDTKMWENGNKPPVTVFPFVESYLGLDINKLDPDWIIACVPFDNQKKVLIKLRKTYSYYKGFQIEEGDAMKFVSNKGIIKFIKNNQDNRKLVILTSFMLYQFSPEDRKTLINEIIQFCKAHSAIWINQDINILNGESALFINGKKVIKLDDEFGLGWKEVG